MPEALAVWGALTGTAGVVLAVRREVVSNRRRLVVAPGVNLTLSRTDPPEVRLAWAAVQVYNGGGRPLAAAGISAFGPLEAFAITTGGRTWFAPPQPLVQAPPPGMTLEQVAEELNGLRDRSDQPHEVEGLVWLNREDPRLVNE